MITPNIIKITNDMIYSTVANVLKIGFSEKAVIMLVKSSIELGRSQLKSLLVFDLNFMKSAIKEKQNRIRAAVSKDINSEKIFFRRSG